MKHPRLVVWLILLAIGVAAVAGTVELWAPGASAKVARGVQTGGGVGSFALALIAVWLGFQRSRSQDERLDVSADSSESALGRDATPLRLEQGKEESTGLINRGWGLVVWNDGPEDARGIHAKLEAIDLTRPTKVKGLNSWPTDRDLHWAGQIDDIDIVIPAGQSARLNVSYYDQSTKTVKLSYHRATEQFREEHALTFDFPILMLINIAGKDRKPVFAVCQIDPKPARDLTFQAYSERSPFTLLWTGVKRRNRSEFQQGSPNELA